MTVSESSVSKMKAVFAEASQLLDINFFLDESELSKEHDIEYIAQVIKGKGYEKTKKKISEFDAQCKEILKNMKFNQDKLMAEYNVCVKSIQSGDLQTNTRLMYLRSQGAVKEADEFYKKQLEARKNIIDKADQIKKRYEDEVLKYKGKEIEFKEQLDKKVEELKTALDQDIVTLLGRLKHIVFSSIRNEEIYKGFILGNLTRVTYMFLYNIIDSTSAQHEATEIFDEVKIEINNIVDNNAESLKKSFLIDAEYLNKCYTMNKPLLSEIENIIKSLPYKQYEDSKPTIENILRTSAEKDFVFKDIIDPEKLNNIKKEIEIYKSELLKSLNENHIVLNNNLSVFDNVNDQLIFLRSKYDQMVRNKETLLTPVSKELYFTFGLLNEVNHFFYMKACKKLTSDISVDFNNVYKVQLSEMLGKIQKTDMLTIPAKQNIDSTILGFPQYKEKLIIKKEELNNKISDLDRLLVEIDDVPKTSSQIYKNKISNWFRIAMIPIVNIVILISMYLVINKLKPAIKSGNSFYDELFQVIINKFKINMYIHIGLVVILGLVSLAYEPLRYLFLVLTLLYIISAIMIFSQKLIIRSFKDTIVQEN
ncbi:MAG TPA: hypothetical protein VF941_13675 [Clostridia bacterium]